MKSRRKFLMTAFSLIIFLGLCFVAAPVVAASAVYVVDVDKALTTSRAARAGSAHLAQARAALDRGYAALAAAWEKQPESARAPVLAEGARALSRQMSIEQQAVTNAVATLMLEEIKAWRAANKANLVIAKSQALDADPDADITEAIIAGMNRREPKFAALPVVNVKSPPQPGTASQGVRAPAQMPATMKTPPVRAPRQRQ